MWQVLPLNPVAEHGSPYSPHSLFAGNPLLLSPNLLHEGGFIPSLPPPSASDQRAVDFREALLFKETLIDNAFDYSFGRVRGNAEFVEFCSRCSEWLDDYALYESIARETGEPWYRWSEGLRDREVSALREKRAALEASVEKAAFVQYLFSKQWSSLWSYAKSKGIRVMGDVPFYVFYDSADIWAHRELFKVDSEGKPFSVGGVPPDYFSTTGQRWGNPVYDWGRMEESEYRWWNERTARSFQLADMLRLDHFRGYVAYWEIPDKEETAVGGQWVKVPASFMASLRRAFPELPFVAEDLGVITDEVRSAIDGLGIPGMRVLQFAFDGDSSNPHLPSNHPANSVVCTGTHDTNTTLGWFKEEATPGQKEALQRFLGRQVGDHDVCEQFMKMAMQSASELCVVPLQDILGLGSEARMNNPGVSTGNWRWRALPNEVSSSALRTLGELAASSGRG